MVNPSERSAEKVMSTKSNATIRRFRLYAALAAAMSCGIALTTTATAGARDGEALTKIVSYADLNLNSEPGARTLYGRLRMAATQVCVPFKGGTLRQQTQWRQCFGLAIARSVKAIDQPMLTAYHLNRIGKSETMAQVAEDQ
jgi:UrcA family protein